MKIRFATTASRTLRAEVVQTAADAEPIDWSVLNEFRLMRQPGQVSLRDRLVSLYLETSRPLVEALSLAVQALDAQQVGKSAHALKSSSANVGALPLAQMLGTLEALARRNELQRIAALKLQIDAEYRRVSAALQADATC